METKKRILYLIIGYLGALAGCYGVLMFNKHLLTSLPLIAGMVCMVVSYWLIALVPIILMCLLKQHPESIGFTEEKKGQQVMIGIVSGLVIASLYFLVPYFMGFGAIVDNGSRYTRLWQFYYELLYFIVAVGAVEEIVFRGFVYSQIKGIFSNEWIAMIGSSILFGLFHILVGNLIQVCVTTIIGFIFCLVRYKIKGCSMLSLILMHGVYDFMIMLYSSLLF
ncbi:MAG: CPBP family intramembrane metalloprotease [Lachnospiraceae bacterium]|nr:CPBP family intramembrane metalloprotease [Lachnospiraceae bacterium]